MRLFVSRKEREPGRPLPRAASVPGPARPVRRVPGCREWDREEPGRRPAARRFNPRPTADELKRVRDLFRIRDVPMARARRA